MVFLGNDLKDELFGDKDAIGETIFINQMPFTVVGVMQKKIQMGTYGGPDANNAVDPAVDLPALFGRRYVSDLVVKATTPERQRGGQEAALRGARRASTASIRPTSARSPMWDTVESQKITAQHRASASRSSSASSAR